MINFGPKSITKLCKYLKMPSVKIKIPKVETLQNSNCLCFNALWRPLEVCYLIAKEELS